MIIFNAYLKIIIYYKKIIAIYLAVFIGIAMLFVMFNTSSSIALTNEDYKRIEIGYVLKNSNDLDQGVVAFLEDNYTLKKLPDNKNNIQDALFYDAVEYVIVIDNDKFTSYHNPKTTNAYLIENKINNYINTYQILKKLNNNNLNINKLTTDNLNMNVKTTSLKYENSSVNEGMVSYFNNYTYSLIACIILGVGYVMISFNKAAIYQKTNISSMPLSKRNKYLFISHIIFGLSIWLLLSGLSLVLFNDSIKTIHYQMMLINSFVFLFPIISLAFLIGNIITKTQILSAVQNTLCLGLSFISGAFIPQVYLNDFVLSLASILPPYWYIKANNEISKLSSFNFKPILGPIIIQISFGILFIIIGIIIARKRNNAQRTLS
ncbi:MAG: ABC transporter permease [Bacilli bacterium]|jgi:ABC-2 type transport system permease protein|nr:ABC transporter permease [Bacilli bacterium]